MPRPLARPSRSGGSPRACRARDARPCGRPRRRRWPRGCPGRPGPRSSALFGPLRAVRPIGMDRRQVDDVEAHALRSSGSRSMQSSKVPWRPGARPCERGNSSYQAAKRRAGPVDDHLELAVVAREIAPRLERAPSPGAGRRRAGRRAGCRARTRPRAGRARREAARLASAVARASRVRRSSAAPSSSSLVRSAWPPASASPHLLRPRSRRRRSTPRSCSGSGCWPRAGTSRSSASLSTGASGRLAPVGLVLRRGTGSTAASTSWPSLKMSAVTVETIAHLALDRDTGRRPPRGARARSRSGGGLAASSPAVHQIRLLLLEHARRGAPSPRTTAAGGRALVSRTSGGGAAQVERGERLGEMAPVHDAGAIGEQEIVDDPWPRAGR